MLIIIILFLPISKTSSKGYYGLGLERGIQEKGSQKLKFRWEGVFGNTPNS